MQQAVLLMGDSGSGKTASGFPHPELADYGLEPIEGLDPDETAYLGWAGAGKTPSFRGWETRLEAHKKPSEGGRFWIATSFAEVKNGLKLFSENPKVKNIWLDDSSIGSGVTVLDHGGKLEFDDWTDTAQRMYKDALKPVLHEKKRDDLLFVLSYHVDLDKRGKIIPKTPGQMLQRYAPIEAMFEWVIFTHTEYDMKTGTTSYRFITNQWNGIPAKTPLGAFHPKDEILIPNDMAIVKRRMEQFRRLAA